MPLAPQNPPFDDPALIGNFNFANWKQTLRPMSDYRDEFTSTSGRATMYGDIPFDQAYIAIANLVGYSYVQGSSLFRVLPVRHPRWRQLFAAHVDIEDIVADGKQVTAVRQEVDKFTGYTKYEKSRLRVTFTPRPYYILSDRQTQGGLEYLRYVEKHPESAEDVILQERGSMTFAEGAGSTEPLAGQTKFNRTWAVIQPKGWRRWTWHEVPLDFVSPDFGSTYTKWDEALGKVNSTAFEGFPAGTLLFRAPEIRRELRILRPLEGLHPLFYVTVTFNFQYFDPAPQGGSNRGHNLVPYNDRKWYLATVDGTVNGDRIYEGYEFRKLFLKHDDPGA